MVGVENLEIVLKNELNYNSKSLRCFLSLNPHHMITKTIKNCKNNKNKKDFTNENLSFSNLTSEIIRKISTKKILGL